MKPSDIEPIDIAHGLSLICRYNGSVDEYYSVAQHSCLMHDAVEDKDIRKQLIFHDAPEYLIGDMVAPLKHMPEFKFYRDLEDEIMLKVCDRFDLPYVFDPIVKELDLAIRRREIQDLKSGMGSIEVKYKHKFDQIKSWSPSKSKSAMIKRMEKLGVKL